MNDAKRQARAAVRPVHAVGALVCAVVIATAIGTVMVPRLRADREHRDRLTRFEAVTASLGQASAVDAALESQVRELRGSVQARRVDLTHTDELNRRLADLTTVLGASGLSVETLQAGERFPVGPVIAMTIRLDGTGPLEQVYELLGVFDRDEPDLHIESLVIEHTGPGTVRLRAILRWLTAPV